MKKALIVVSFGTSYPETRQKTIAALEQRMAETFPEYDVFRAFTSTMVIKKVAQQEGLQVATVEEVMTDLKAAGYQEVYLQPLHIINGSEYFKAVDQALAFQKDFEKIVIGEPLLTSFEDYQKVILWMRGLAADFKEDEALVLMGHGTHHSAFTAYACLDHMVADEPLYICAVESYPELETVLAKLKRDKVRKVQLYPLMLVAGDHATNDMASNEEDSWKSQLEQAGFSVEAHVVGMGEFAEIQRLFVQHAQKAIERGA